MKSNETRNIIVNAIQSKQLKMRLILAITMCFVVLLCHILTKPQAYSYNQLGEQLEIIESNGNVLLSYTNDIEVIERSDSVFDITLINTLVNKLTAQNNRKTHLLNPDNKKVNQINYISYGKDEDKVIFGLNEALDSQTITLPRLALNAYFLLEGICCFILLLLLVIFRHKHQIARYILFITLIPLSLIISQLLITGFSATTYTLTRDILFIVAEALCLTLSFYYLIKVKETS